MLPRSRNLIVFAPNRCGLVSTSPFCLPAGQSVQSGQCLNFCILESTLEPSVSFFTCIKHSNQVIQTKVKGGNKLERALTCFLARQKLFDKKSDPARPTLDLVNVQILPSITVTGFFFSVISFIFDNSYCFFLQFHHFTLITVF